MGFSIGQCCNVDSYQRRNLLMAGKCERNRNESDGCGREVNLIEREEKKCDRNESNGLLAELKIELHRNRYQCLPRAHFSPANFGPELDAL